MALKKRPKPQAGVPEWIVTFGDLMSLLLCFFVLLQIFSEPKKDEEYERVVTAIKEAFGYAGGIGVLPIDDPPLRSMIEQLEAIAVRAYEESKVSQSDAKGIDGPQMRVKTVREGIVFTIGGAQSFEPGSAEVKQRVREELEQLSALLAGRHNKIVIRGHASPMYLPDDSPWKDLDDLSYARAKNIMNVLVEFGLNTQVFRLEAVGTREPVDPRAIEPDEAGENRRVEIILTEQLVEELNTDAYFTNPDLARGS